MAEPAIKYLEMLQAKVGQRFGTGSPSPFGRWLDGLLLEAEEGLIRAEFEVREEMTNPVGMLHGGATAAIIDDLIGTMVATLNRPSFYASVNLHIDFLTASRAGRTITGTARVVRPGRTLINAECELRDHRDRLVARGVSNLIKVR
ncbi:MAG: PaaI family thioesterase [Bacteroidota bacterium]